MATFDHTDAKVVDGILTITGTSGDDNIIAYGTDEDVNIIAGNGDDTIYATNGNNVINAGIGDDLIHFTNGIDTVDGGYGDDQVHFHYESIDSLSHYEHNNGIVTISTSNGSTTTYSNVERFSFGYDNFAITYSHATLDAVYGISNQIGTGTTDHDNLAGSTSNDNINALTGDDFIQGLAGDDVINGGDGNDIIYGGKGNDTLLGGAGNDIIAPSTSTATFRSNNVIDGGEGEDTLYYNLIDYWLSDYLNENGKITINLGGYATDTATNIEYIDFKGSKRPISYYDQAYSRQPQSISGTNDAETILGGLNDDTITGLAGNDIIKARSGNDTVDGGDGDDEIIGGSGTLVAHGGIGNDKITSGEENDILYGNAGDDHIDAAEGNDFIDGGDGNDRLDIIVGYEVPWNKSGELYEIDHVSKLKIGGYLIISSWGQDEVHNVETVALQHTYSSPGPKGTSVTLLNTELITLESLINNNTTPTIDFNQTDIAPNIYTGPVDYLQYEFMGEMTNDTITGSMGNDFFNLKDGDDAAEGGVGDDVLDGGAGSNFLTGGEGDDTFFLDGRDGNVVWSTITDFDNEEVNIWGWNEGVSKLLSSEDDAGADGFKGATLHYDLNNDGAIDTSITFSGLTLSEIPQSIASTIDDTGYLFFGQCGTFSEKTLITTTPAIIKAMPTIAGQSGTSPYKYMLTSVTNTMPTPDQIEYVMPTGSILSTKVKKQNEIKYPTPTNKVGTKRVNSSHALSALVATTSARMAAAKKRQAFMY